MSIVLPNKLDTKEFCESWLCSRIYIRSAASLLNLFRLKLIELSYITRFKQIIIFAITICLLLLVSGCATYKSSFNCGDAKGAYCASMDHVDQMIDNGEIENFNEQRLNKKYKQTNSNILPLKIKANPVKIISYEEDDAGN